MCVNSLFYLFSAPSRLDKPHSLSARVNALPTPRTPPPISTDIVEEIDTKSSVPPKDYSWYWGDLSRYVL